MKRLRAFTLVELLVVIGIIALLISILLPSLNKARQAAILISCQAKMRDFGNAILLYVQDYKQTLPGPCLGQVRAGYDYDVADGREDNLIANYIYRYLRLPPPPKDGTYIIAKALYCPGYEASNSGVVVDARSFTYSMQFADPYPWFGYGSKSPFPEAAARHPELVGTKAPWVGAMMPMKITQVWKPSETPMMADTDNAFAIYSGASFDPNAKPPHDEYQSISKIPNHGGRPETKNASPGSDTLQQDPVTLNYSFYIIDPTAATNPPRNWLYFDGHVATDRTSAGVLPFPPR